MGSLSALLRLTEAADWQTRLDITVYQLGWRLGGKGASGRNMTPGFHHRIEEHGVHVFFGFYTNAFRLMKACYEELGRPPGALLRTWDEAFKGLNNVVLAERMPNGEWDTWQFKPPPVSGQPFDDRSSPDLGDCLETVTTWFMHALGQPKALVGDAFLAPGSLALQASLVTFEQTRLALAPQLAALIQQAHHASVSTFSTLGAPDALPGSGARLHSVLGVLVGTLAATLRTFWLLFEPTVRQPGSPLERQVRKTWLLCNFIYANLHGIHADRLLLQGVRQINHRDYGNWIEQHGLDDGGATRFSSLVRWLYDAVFCYRDGDIGRPNLEAGTGLLATLRVLFTYNGDFLYKMQAGMGDVVFAPIYQVLRARGVKFEFFHRVLALDVATVNGRRIVSQVHLERQTRPKDAAQAYRPLVEVTDSDQRTLPCWPAQPDYDQLDEGQLLQAALESAGRTLEEYTPSPHQAPIVLKAGDDFHQVLLGIGLGAARSVCRQLIDAEPAWQALVSNVGTVATVGVQLWLNRELPTLNSSGAPLQSPAILCGYDYDAAPIDSYADMTQVLRRESWPPGPDMPRSIAYFCSPLNDARPTEGAAGAAAAQQLAHTMLQQHIGPIWPRATTAGGGFDWSLLVDPRAQPGTGPSRLDAQFSVGVANPSDRYVATFAGSTVHRLWADQSGFDNLVLTGDWVRNTFDIGCIEATAMAGLQAANALLGRRRDDGIAGWNVF